MIAAQVQLNWHAPSLEIVGAETAKAQSFVDLSGCDGNRVFQRNNRGTSPHARLYQLHSICWCKVLRMAPPLAVQEKAPSSMQHMLVLFAQIVLL
jgi:hypothetical protein